MSNETDSAVSSAISIGDKAGPGPLLLKILVPAYAAGSIIGKKLGFGKIYDTEINMNKAEI